MLNDLVFYCKQRCRRTVVILKRTSLIVKLKAGPSNLSTFLMNPDVQKFRKHLIRLKFYFRSHENYAVTERTFQMVSKIGQQILLQPPQPLQCRCGRKKYLF